MRVQSDNRGFSMVEVLIGMIIFALCLQGLAMMGARTIAANETGMKTTAATMLAQDRIEYVKSLGYNNLNGAETIENYGDMGGYELYRRQTTVLDNTPQQHTKTVVVEVQWDNGEHSYQLETIVADPGA